MDSPTARHHPIIQPEVDTLRAMALNRADVIQPGEGNRPYAIFTCFLPDPAQERLHPDFDRAFRHLTPGEEDPLMAQTGQTYLLTGAWSCDQAFEYDTIQPG